MFSIFTGIHTFILLYTILNAVTYATGDNMDTAVTKAYQSLLLLTVRQPDNVEYLHFAEEVKNRSKRDYGYEFGKDEVSLHIVALTRIKVIGKVLLLLQS